APSGDAPEPILKCVENVLSVGIVVWRYYRFRVGEGSVEGGPRWRIATVLHCDGVRQLNVAGYVQAVDIGRFRAQSGGEFGIRRFCQIFRHGRPTVPLQWLAPVVHSGVGRDGGYGPRTDAG